MEAGPPQSGRVAASGAGVAPETRGLIMFLHVVMVIAVVGLIVGFAIIDV